MSPQGCAWLEYGAMALNLRFLLTKFGMRLVHRVTQYTSLLGIVTDKKNFPVEASSGMSSTTEARCIKQGNVLKRSEVVRSWNQRLVPFAWNSPPVKRASSDVCGLCWRVGDPPHHAARALAQAPRCAVIGAHLRALVATPWACNVEPVWC
jgi:hypothetical protein